MLRNLSKYPISIRMKPFLALTANYSNTSVIGKLRVSILGRPNVGKSTLFNRLTKSKLAIVSSIPGTTRDRKEGEGFIAGLNFHVTDTGGLDDRGAVSSGILEQVEAAMGMSHVVLFMIDAKEGITSVDEYYAQWLRKRLRKNDFAKNCEVYLVANKTEGGHLSDRVVNIVAESYKLGFGEPLLISASQGDGMTDLATLLINEAQQLGFDNVSNEEKSVAAIELNSLIDHNVEGYDVDLESAEPKLEDRKIQLSIMGRPNVGKSSILNGIVGQSRVIAGPLAGLTRDSISVDWEHNGRRFVLVDTAGLTRIRPNADLLTGEREKFLAKELENSTIEVLTPLKPNVQLPGVREMSPSTDPSQFSYQVSECALISALNALRFSQVVVIVVEPEQGTFSNVDLQLARKCLQEGRAVIIAANKADLVGARGITATQYEDGVRGHCEEFIREFGEVPIIACSATENRGLLRLLNAVVRVHDAWSRRISTGLLNAWLKDVMVTAPTARAGKKAINVKFLTQVKVRPPTFAVFSNVTEFPGFFHRFLMHRLQREFKLEGVPIRFVLRKSQGNPVKKELLRQGKQSRRGAGHGEARGVGPRNRSKAAMIKMAVKRDSRRRRDSRLNRLRK